MSFQFKDIYAAMLQKRLWQYQTSDTLTSLTFAMLSQYQDYQEILEELYNVTDIDTQVLDSFSLDLVGQLIGLKRFPIRVHPGGEVLQWDVTNWDQYPFGDTALINDYFLITDPQYLRCIKAFGISSNSVGDTNSLIRSLAALLGLSESEIVVQSILGSNNAVIEVDIDEDLFFWDEELLRHKLPNFGFLWASLAGFEYRLNFNTGTITI